MTHIPIPFEQVPLTHDFWGEQQRINAEAAIFHQWAQLEQSGCIENFRIAAGESPHRRTGFFFSDSDAHKWLDAACRIMIHRPSDPLKSRITAYADLIRRVQSPDGYLYTYNQIHFPGTQWTALAIEHELYCHGHLIEACLAHHDAFPEGDLLDMAVRAADKICSDFLDQPPHRLPGHAEIELALLNLYEVTGKILYIQMAQQFLKRRGRDPWHTLHLIGDLLLTTRRSRAVARQAQAHAEAHPNLVGFELPPMNHAPTPPGLLPRFAVSAVSGKYFQHHKPLHHQKKPTGHAVRFGYTQAAAALEMRLSGERGNLAAMTELWDHMTRHRMAPTGGLGALPLIEGFGRDGELDPHLTYDETCAALAGMLWNRELTCLTGDARYADLIEWQLYNAALVGLGLDGRCYLYNNPLAADGEMARQPWFRIPCCPSNISRIWASLGGFQYTSEKNQLFVHQYFSGSLTGERDAPLQMRLDSRLPWDPEVRIHIQQINQDGAGLFLRMPAWAQGAAIWRNGDPVDSITPIPDPGPYAPFRPQFIPFPGEIQRGDRIEIHFETPITPLQTPHGTVLTRGPLVYCFESVDNPGVDLAALCVDAESFVTGKAAGLEGMTVLVGRTAGGKPVTAVPYFAWANRGASVMRVFVKEKS